jgi:hypothetical protein
MFAQTAIPIFVEERINVGLGNYHQEKKFCGKIFK